MVCAVTLIACNSGEEAVESVDPTAATSPLQTTVPASSTTATPLATTAASIAGSTDVVPTPPSTRTPLPDVDSVFQTLLAQIPDRDSSLELLLAVNFERAAAGLDLPDRTTDPENWYRALSLDPDGPFARSLVISTPQIDQWRAEVGFSVPDELGEARVQDRDGSLDLHLVDVDAAAIDRAVRTEPVWSDVLIDAEVAGIPYYTWGEVDMSIATQTATHEWVEGGYMAVSDHVVLRTMNEDLFLDSLTVTPGRSLADNPDVALILDSFAEHQVYSMALTNDMPLLEQHGYERLMVLPYRLLGTGQAFQDDRRQTVLAYVHDDQDTAIENAARLDAILTNEVGSQNVPYTDKFASYDIAVDGVLVSVVLDMGSTGIGYWLESLLREDPLYWADASTADSG